MRNKRLLFLGVEPELQHDVEKIDRILQGQWPAVMKIRRAVLDVSQRKGVD